MPRTSNREAQVLEEHLEEFNIPVRPIAVVTKAATLTEEQKKDLQKALGGFSPIFVDSLKKDEQGRPLGFEALGERITRAIAEVPVEAQKLRLRELAKKGHRLAKRAEKLAKETFAEEALEEDIMLRRVLDRADEVWNRVLKTVLTARVKEIVLAKTGRAKEVGRRIAKEITRGIGGKIKIYLTGGPSLEEISRLENEVQRAFLEGLEKDLTSVITKELAQLKGKSKQSDLMSRAVAVVGEALTVPLPQIGKEGLLEGAELLVKDLQNAYNLSETLVEFLKGQTRATREVGKELHNFARQHTAEAAALSLSAAASGGGAIEAAAEAAGGGLVAGAANLPSAIAGIAGAVVAAVGLISIAVTVLRGVRRIELEIDTYVNSVASAMSNAVMEELTNRLEIFWQVYRFALEQRLVELLGSKREEEIVLKMRAAANEAQKSAASFLSQE